MTSNSSTGYFPIFVATNGTHHSVHRIEPIASLLKRDGSVAIPTGTARWTKGGMKIETSPDSALMTYGDFQNWSNPTNGGPGQAFVRASKTFPFVASVWIIGGRELVVQRRVGSLCFGRRRQALGMILSRGISALVLIRMTVLLIRGWEHLQLMYLRQEKEVLTHVNLSMPLRILGVKPLLGYKGIMLSFDYYALSGWLYQLYLYLIAQISELLCSDCAISII